MGNKLLDKYGDKVFSDEVMQKRLPKNVYASLKETSRMGTKLDVSIANVVATAMKEWAIEQGATHYSHWFQPMTNITAGKHDSFLNITPDGRIMTEFSGTSLTQGEPDASSFPNGGLRATFEARGYTAWDPTSPAFVRDATLYIPTAFCSYAGEALDKKTPLLRSMQAISKEAMRIIRLFGNIKSKNVVATVGAEQEYFLIDREIYEKRPDLKICGRTLFGTKPPKGQELDDHYCGRIRLRVASFMKDLDSRLWELGVPSKTRHNEAAPAQHELAPIFTTANIACDHNQLIMEVMRETAKEHKLACLLHEKPFRGVNGSGKHNNWSLSTDDGINLLDPGKTPYDNMQFLTILCAIIRAVDKHADLLRTSAATPGNERRLGECEAPPSIISIYLGETLTDILTNLSHYETPHHQATKFLETGVATLPRLPKDSSDRNRTSPFAFTGNKFEFRMVGASDSIATATCTINTIVTESLREFADRLENSADFDSEVAAIIASTIRENGKIIYNGNNYSNEWLEIAKQRGLPIITNVPDAADILILPKNVKLFHEMGIFTPEECDSRRIVMLENYVQVTLIEARTMIEMSSETIAPQIIKYCGDMAKIYNELSNSGIQCNTLYDKISQLSCLYEEITESIDKLSLSVKNLEEKEDESEKASACCNVIDQLMETLRRKCDTAETLLGKSYCKFPGYSDILYSV